MKKVLFLMACIASTGVFFLGQKTPEKSSDLSAENIEVVGLSALKITCDPNTTSECIVREDSFEAIGRGTLIIEKN